MMSLNGNQGANMHTFSQFKRLQLINILR